MWLQSSELMTEHLCLRENTVSVNQWHSWCGLHTVSSIFFFFLKKVIKHIKQKQAYKENKQDAIEDVSPKDHMTPSKHLQRTTASLHVVIVSGTYLSCKAFFVLLVV